MENTDFLSGADNQRESVNSVLWVNRLSAGYTVRFLSWFSKPGRPMCWPQHIDCEKSSAVLLADVCTTAQLHRFAQLLHGNPHACGKQGAQLRETDGVLSHRRIRRALPECPCEVSLTARSREAHQSSRRISRAQGPLEFSPTWYST
jgi:hypothetical protein